MMERQKALFCKFLFFGNALIINGYWVVGWGKKSYLGPAEIASFSSRDFSWSNKHNTFWNVVSTGYSFVLFLWAIAVPDFCPLETYKNLGLPLSTITFIVNSMQTTIFINICLLQIYNMKSVFFIKTHVKFFYIQIWFKCEALLLFFLVRTIV